MSEMTNEEIQRDIVLEEITECILQFASDTSRIEDIQSAYIHCIRMIVNEYNDKQFDHDDFVMTILLYTEAYESLLVK